MIKHMFYFVNISRREKISNERDKFNGLLLEGEAAGVLDVYKSGVREGIANLAAGSFA